MSSLKIKIVNCIIILEIKIRISCSYKTTQSIRYNTFEQTYQDICRQNGNSISAPKNFVYTPVN